jgi:hypothetical protein
MNSFYSVFKLLFDVLMVLDNQCSGKVLSLLRYQVFCNDSNSRETCVLNQIDNLRTPLV